MFTGVRYEFKGLPNPEINSPSPHPLQVLPEVRGGPAHPVKKCRKSFREGRQALAMQNIGLILINQTTGLIFLSAPCAEGACTIPVPLSVLSPSPPAQGSSTNRPISSKDQSSWDLLVPVRPGSGDRAGAVAPSGESWGSAHSYCFTQGMLFHF